MKSKKVTKIIRNLKIFVKKNKSEIILGCSVTAIIGGTVAASIASTKVKEVFEEDKINIEKLHEMREVTTVEEYSKQSYAKDLIKYYGVMVWDIAKLYGPAVLIEGAGIAGVFVSNGILRKRCAELGAAYAAVDAAFKQYRKNVVEKYGEEVDKELRYGLKKEKIETIVVDENGKEKKVKSTEYICDKDISLYARFFDEDTFCYQKDEYGNPQTEYNLQFLKMQEKSANERLRREGYLFLNDVYKMLGFEPTKAGNQVGWIYDESADAEESKIDSFVDFGIYNTRRANRRFVNGYENVILLDFNVDGVILDSPKLKLAAI